MSKERVYRVAIRYSEAFKREVVRELEDGQSTVAAIQRKYGVSGAVTVQRWVGRYGNGTRGKVIRVEKPEEINQTEQLKRRVRQLETALADANIDLAMERAYTKMACDRAGIKDVEEFKKKADGEQRTRR
jgi:transposase-like protein